MYFKSIVILMLTTALVSCKTIDSAIQSLDQAVGKATGYYDEDGNRARPKKTGPFFSLDLLGFKPGITRAEAVDFINKQIPGNTAVKSNRVSYINQSENIAFDFGTLDYLGKDYVYYISKSEQYPEGKGPSYNDLRAKLFEKFGKPTEVNDPTRMRNKEFRFYWIYNSSGYLYPNTKAVPRGFSNTYKMPFMGFVANALPVQAYASPNKITKCMSCKYIASAAIRLKEWGGVTYVHAYGVTIADMVTYDALLKYQDYMKKKAEEEKVKKIREEQKNIQINL